MAKDDEPKVVCPSEDDADNTITVDLGKKATMKWWEAWAKRYCKQRRKTETQKGLMAVLLKTDWILENRHPEPFTEAQQKEFTYILQAAESEFV